MGDGRWWDVYDQSGVESILVGIGIERTRVVKSAWGARGGGHFSSGSHPSRASAISLLSSLSTRSWKDVGRLCITSRQDELFPRGSQHLFLQASLGTIEKNKGPGARAGHFPSFFSLFCNAKNPFFQQDPLLFETRASIRLNCFFFKIRDKGII